MLLMYAETYASLLLWSDFTETGTLSADLTHLQSHKSLELLHADK